MRTIGLIGGMSWESTATYYRLINSGIKQQLGGFHSAQIILNSLDFAPIEQLQQQGDWQQMEQILCEASQSVEKASADFLLICTNTMHKVAPAVEQTISIPLLHIADATANSLLANGVKKVALLGTAFTMEQDFYKGRLQDMFGIEVVVPEEQARAEVHRIIYSELCQGMIESSSKQIYLDIISQLGEQGAEAVILGCTEIGLLVNSEDTSMSLYDTTEIHAAEAVRMALL